MEAWVESSIPERRGEAMVVELAGVPRPALQTVFGKALGRRIWDCARHLGDCRHRLRPTLGDDSADGSTVDDAEIVGGMIAYVCRRAGEALRESGREAKSMGLRLEYADGVATLQRMRLARPTNEGSELREAAMDLLGRSQMSGVVVESVDLRLTSVQTEPVNQRAGSLHCAMVSAAAGVPA
jgi:hypothetical protein